MAAPTFAPPGLVMTDVLLRRRERGVLWLTLNRPEKLNALNRELISTLLDALDAVTVDDARVVAITASGNAFSAGADLAEVRETLADPDEFRAWLEHFGAALDAIESHALPVVAGVDGFCLAGGLELALACDLVVASDRARLGDGHVQYGLVPGGGASVRLPETVGRRAARWLMYSGSALTADHAHRLGLVQEVLPVDEFGEGFGEFVGRMARRSPAALGAMKLMTGSDKARATRFAAEIETAVRVVTGPEAAEGLAAFIEKREPDFGP